MDQIDLDIIALLQENGRRPYTEIAQALNVSEGTVRNRVARLQEEKIIQIVGMADPYQLNYDAPAIIGISVNPQQMDDVTRALASLREVSYLVMISGEFDLLVEVLCKDRDELTSLLNDRIRSIDGVTRTQTFFILHTYKMAYGALPVMPSDQIQEKIDNEKGQGSS
jgi:Lrp/AsnC family transcriptional regulator for asnA, asnC and gidA